MYLEFPKMLYRLDGQTRVVPDTEAEALAFAEGWLLHADYQRLLAGPVPAIADPPAEGAPKPKAKLQKA